MSGTVRFPWSGEDFRPSRPETVYRDLYIHVPFCRRKCGYCAFYSVTGEAASPRMQEAWLERLAGEMGRRRFSKPLRSIYFGGGTPTLPDTGFLKRLRSVCAALLKWDAGTEITFEANPETLDDEKLEFLSDFATRLSVGVQSFDSERRRRLGRECSREAIDRVLARAAGTFRHLNVDLICGLAGDDGELWRRELALAADSGADHVSCYELTPEEQAALRFQAPDAETGARLWRITGEFLAGVGIRRYEISNYARPGGECRHNLAVWDGEPLCGIGPSASGFDGVDRWTERCDLEEWLAHRYPVWDVIAPEKREAEIFAVGLRRTAGWDETAAKRFSPEMLSAASKLKSELPGLFMPGGGFVLNESGLLLWNEVAEKLL